MPETAAMRCRMIAKKGTYLQTLHRAHRTATLNRLVDLFVERLPIIEWSDTEELDKGVEFFDIILPDVR